MNRIRPLAGAVLATLMLLPMAGLAAEVLPLDPGGGLAPPIDGTGPAGGTELAPPTAARESNSSDSDYIEEPMLQTRHFALQAELSCTVGTTPNAIVVVNHSAEALPAGTRIKWQLKNEGKRGFFALIGPLGGGETLVADNVLDGDASQGANCVARTI